MRSVVAVWHCRCGYSNPGPRRCVGCHKPSPSFRRQLRKRRLISAACLAATVTVSSAKWSPLVGQAAAPTPTTLPPPPTTIPPAPPPPPAPAPPPQAPATPGPRADLPRRDVQDRPALRRQPRQPIAAPRAGAAAPGSNPAQARCLAARQAVENAGDHLAPGFGFRCPASDYPRWGATTLSPCGPCFVTINIALIGRDDAKLRHVVAHEFCHSNGIRDEQAADDCAAHYGFPNIYFTR
jgi:hypothetical protein